LEQFSASRVAVDFHTAKTEKRKSFAPPALYTAITVGRLALDFVGF
jgi:hypothetical protein